MSFQDLNEKCLQFFSLSGAFVTRCHLWTLRVPSSVTLSTQLWPITQRKLNKTTQPASTVEYSLTHQTHADTGGHLSINTIIIRIIITKPRTSPSSKSLKSHILNEEWGIWSLKSSNFQKVLVEVLKHKVQKYLRVLIPNWDTYILLPRINSKFTGLSLSTAGLVIPVFTSAGWSLCLKRSGISEDPGCN